MHSEWLMNSWFPERDGWTKDEERTEMLVSNIGFHMGNTARETPGQTKQLRGLGNLINIGSHKKAVLR